MLTDWIVNAAHKKGLPVQATSIPGVAQRTGATTYYVEMMPAPSSGGRAPILALSPSIGEIDLMVASEFLEAGRAIGGGFVTPDRTTLIASTHRVFTTDEKIEMADGRLDLGRSLQGGEGAGGARHPVRRRRVRARNPLGDQFGAARRHRRRGRAADRA